MSNHAERAEPRARRVRSPLVALAAIVGAVLLGACGLRLPGLGIEGQLTTNDANDSDQSVSLASTLAAVPALTLNGSQATLAEAVAAQSSAPQLFSPSGCLVVTTEGNVVTYTFDACTGPWGAIEVSGVEVATFSPGSKTQSLQIDMHSEGLSANDVAIDHEATALVYADAAGKHIEWSGSYEGKTAKGKLITHEADLDILLGVDGCAHLDGSTSTRIGLRGLDIDYQGLERCGPFGTCPSGVVVATGAFTHYSVTLEFDGTPQGVATGENGGEYEFSFACTPP